MANLFRWLASLFVKTSIDIDVTPTIVLKTIENWDDDMQPGLRLKSIAAYIQKNKSQMTKTELDKFCIKMVNLYNKILCGDYSGIPGGRLSEKVKFFDFFKNKTYTDIFKELHIRQYKISYSQSHDKTNIKKFSIWIHNGDPGPIWKDTARQIRITSMS